MFDLENIPDELLDDSEYHEDAQFIHLASEWMKELGYRNQLDWDEALKRTFDACCALNISIELNFRKVYIYDGKSLQPDWELTDLGCYLFLINGDPSNPKVAKAQLYFARAASKAHH
jgi:DNA-damage-inducible protein D